MKQLVVILSLIISIGSVAQKPQKKTLEAEMLRIKTGTVLVVQSQAIDEYPIWSAESDYVGCNVMGKWFKIRLTNIRLGEATWRNQTIGFISTKNAVSKMTEKEIEAFMKVSELHPREVITSDGIKIELRMDGFQVALVVTKKGQKPEVLWKSEGENCHSLSVSPDEKYVAYLCEMNGLLIMKIH
ncbi:hypothetical protein GCM10009118_01020 [Wandonia haliotis]|uniref:Ig-like domain-containing protein n=1 Tax=Wandonia haliotis TaxID=574963 RepID=A0ABN1MLC1_9FLAO